LLIEKAAAATYVPLYAEAATPEEKLPELAEALTPMLPISVMLLGMGADMHTASIFPGADQLDLALRGDDHLVAMRAPGAPEPRITLSANVLNSAMSRHLVIVGAEKRAALERARELPHEQAPVGAILGGTTVHWAER
jgi:6-phosphogluconolactonase